MAQLTHEQLFAQAAAWAANDPDPETREELTQLIDSKNTLELQERFSTRLKFGTAGLRAEMGAGPARMNRVVIMQSSAGFARFLRNRHQGDGDSSPTVVVGYDGRKNSQIFALDAARVFAGYGLRALLMPHATPTPVTAYAVRRYQADAGVMITASHNPPNDNGYKVYLGGADAGSQIIPPQDAQIAAEIDAVAATDLAAIPVSDGYEKISDFIVTEYLAATVSALTCPETQAVAAPTPLKIVYTAMHGVGSQITQRLFEIAKLPQLIPVPEQDQPDGTFPTVAFPNPEEAGALDLAYKLAKEQTADLIIAQDPDADRLAVALPDPHAKGEYVMLTGNQVGLLLGWQAAKKAAADYKKPAAIKPALACTIVSSPALAAVAAHYGLNYQETLSGFKWVSRVPGLVFGFEEALGYLVTPEVVRDKDGVSAALAITQLACRLQREGRTLWDELDSATELFGAFASRQVTIRCKTTDAAHAMFATLRQNPPKIFSETAVENFTDLAHSSNINMRADVLRFDLADNSRIMCRVSGTEPKLKIYIDTRCTDGTVEERNETAQTRARQLSDVVTELLAKLN